MRFLRFYYLTALTVLFFFVGQAGAVEIDRELRDLLQDKSAGEMVPVLLLFDEAAGIEKSRLQLEGLAPQQRRRVVLENLRGQADRIQAGVLEYLADPTRAGKVGRVQTLYLAGALAFEASPEMVASMAALPDAATLYYDKAYDLTSGTSRGPAPEMSSVTATTAVDTAWSVKYINADKVWNDYGFTGAGVVVGHIDTGIFLSHPDLASRLWVNPGEIPGNGIDDDNNGFVDDINGWDFGEYDNNPNDDSNSPGHGTHTAGTVAGDGTGGTLTGVAPGAVLMPAKVWRSDGTGGTLAMIWAGQQYCVENGARIITMSLGIPGDIAPYFMHNERMNCNNIRDAGVVFFNSAGNDHYLYTPPIELSMTARVPAPWQPAGYPHSSSGGVISVGGTGYKSDVIYDSSSRGPAHWGNVEPWTDWPYQPGPGLIKPDVAAPGVGINSTVIPSGYSGDSWNGTSMACPHAAGVAALMMEKNPSLSPAGVDSIMEKWSVDLGAPGKDNDFGSGRLNAQIILAATPLIQVPHISWTAVYPDPFGDEVLDPGETSRIAFQLVNNSPVVQAISVTGFLEVMPNPHVSVIDYSGTFDDMPANGGTSDNLGNSFSLAIASAAPQGYEFTMLLTVTSDLYFQKTFDITGTVGLPDFRTHDIGDIYLTVTDQGSIGYMAQGGGGGDGMGPAGVASDLFVSSFWAGTGPDYICNRDYNGLGTEIYEWVVSDPEPNGRVRDLGTVRSDQTFQAIFTDGGHASPLPLSVEQTSLSFLTESNGNFVILEYRLTNQGTAPVPALYTGVYGDFDIGEDSSQNMGGTDPVRKMTYLYAPEGNYYGIVLLGAQPAQNLTLVDNPLYVYANFAVSDQNKFNFLTGALSRSDGQYNNDWSMLASSVMSLDGAGGQGTVAYAMVYGADLESLRDNADAAIAAYNPLAPITNETPIKVFRLGQNHPNPFNPVTNIRFSLEKEGPVELAVFDVGGRKIRTLVMESRGPGDYTATWDGTDQSGSRVPSGMYFYKLSAGVESETRKMMMLK